MNQQMRGIFSVGFSLGLAIGLLVGYFGHMVRRDFKWSNTYDNAATLNAWSPFTLMREPTAQITDEQWNRLMKRIEANEDINYCVKIIADRTTDQLTRLQMEAMNEREAGEKTPQVGAENESTEEENVPMVSPFAVDGKKI